MLVLSRGPGEEIVIAEGEIRVTLIEIRGNKARIGITAPKDIPIYRSEIYEEIERERAAGRRNSADAIALATV